MFSSSPAAGDQRGQQRDNRAEGSEASTSVCLQTLLVLAP